ncbi:hypothetical protein OESDEN_20662 [Oesophagostomum dentatum]|uniref:Uncharacterized protein n=1 Tax=Oesophagostomum dentatum TaxID=61180 RepID=A0A0B1S441_OESDE|nr:hypothetical protein OESDEN_20662 [Oesophagostomum dentatum]
MAVEFTSETPMCKRQLVCDAMDEFPTEAKNVCPHEEVEIVTIKQPCIERYTKYVRTRKPGCNGQFRSCSVREPK